MEARRRRAARSGHARRAPEAPRGRGPAPLDAPGGRDRREGGVHARRAPRRPLFAAGVPEGLVVRPGPARPPVVGAAGRHRGFHREARRAPPDRRALVRRHAAEAGPDQHHRPQRQPGRALGPGALRAAAGRGLVQHERHRGRSRGVAFRSAERRAQGGRDAVADHVPAECAHRDPRARRRAEGVRGRLAVGLRGPLRGHRGAGRERVAERPERLGLGLERVRVQLLRPGGRELADRRRDLGDRSSRRSRSRSPRERSPRSTLEITDAGATGLVVKVVAPDGAPVADAQVRVFARGRAVGLARGVLGPSQEGRRLGGRAQEGRAERR